MPKNFPKDFVWGTATSGHQTEGNNKNSDWWHWENRQPKDNKWPLEPSLQADDSYNRYEEDFELCQQLHNNAVRIGIEWARLEPEPGKFSENEFDHYKKVLLAAKAKGLKTFVTLWHFTSPQWLAEQGGWTNLNTPKLFARFAQKCADELDPLIDTYLTLNEPQVYSMQSYLLGLWPPQKKNPILSFINQFVFISAHNKAYAALKKVTTKPIGIVKNIVWYKTPEHLYLLKPLDVIVAKTLYWLNCDFFIRLTKNDVLGLNHYFTNVIHNLWVRNPNDIVNDLGWWVHPAALEKLLLDLKKFRKPIYITESGCADSTDRIRADLLKGILTACHKAIEKGSPLKGYFHWSLLDNYEWAHGFAPRFGLVEVERNNNLARKPRPSFYLYSKICETNSLS